MQKIKKWIALVIIVFVLLGIFAFDFYLYRLNHQLTQKVQTIENQMKLQNRYTDMLDFAYNFMSRIASKSLFDEPEYYEKHLTSNVLQLLKSHVGWDKKILHYAISGITTSGNGQSILKVNLTVINKFDKEQSVVIYLYIEGNRKQFIVTHFKAYDLNKPAVREEA